MLLHGARVMESVKPILDSETRTEDVKEQVNTSDEARVLEFNVLCNYIFMINACTSALQTHPYHS